MKIEVSNKDFVTYLILFLLLIFCIVIWMKIDYVRFVNQVNTNTNNVLNIDAYLQQQDQLRKQQQMPEFELVPKKKEEVKK